MDLQSRQQFWNHKILTWETSSYYFKKWPFVDLKKRLLYAKKFLQKHGASKSILEIGCGSGLLLEGDGNHNFSQYTGIDFSTVAIAQARQRHQGKSQINFSCLDLKDTPWVKGDLIICLGVIDWLSDDEIKFLFSKLEGKNFLLSFSNRDQKLFYFLHRAYIFFKRGWRPKAYCPRYFSEHQIAQLATAATTKFRYNTFHLSGIVSLIESSTSE